MSKDLILITGATGMVGFRTLIFALQAGYRVRAAVRSQERANAVLSAPAYKEIASSLSPDQVSFVTVPDLEAPGAYDKAVERVAAVLHIASPLTSGNELSQEEYRKKFIKPAVKGTIGMLESAAKSSSVKRVVITSSVVAVIPFTSALDPNNPDQTIYNDDSRIPTDEGPYVAEFHAYTASKAAALNATTAWVKEHQPSFDVVNIGPSFIEGRDDLNTSASGSIRGTNAAILAMALGQDLPVPLPGATVHLEDVAHAHVKALDADVPAGMYLLNTDPASDWSLVAGIVKKLFPEAVKKGTLKASGKGVTVPLRIDASKAKKVLGYKNLGLEEQVKSVVGHYVELVESGKP